MSFSLVLAKIFQGLGPKRRESSNGDQVYGQFSYFQFAKLYHVVYIYIYIYIHVHMCIHVCMYVYIYIYVYGCMDRCKGNFPTVSSRTFSSRNVKSIRET